MARATSSARADVKSKAGVKRAIGKKVASADQDLCFLSAIDLIKGYRAGRFSPLEAMQAVFRRIDEVNPKVNAIVTQARDSALDQARAATRALRKGRALAPLHGIPVAIKDVTPTKGLRTTWGSKVLEHHVPAKDALIVQRLRAAGAIVIGKTNTPEFAAGANTFNDVFGATRNPWNLALSAGGSSGGSAAALATGMSPLAEGSDLGGSLRTPAAFCGVVGFRGSPGLVPMYPSQLAWNSLSVQGPMARTVADIAHMLTVIAGRDDRDAMSYDLDTRAFTKAVRQPSIAGWKIAWSRDLNGLLPVDSELADVCERALKVFRTLGASVKPACPDFSDLEDIVMGTRGLSMVALHAEKLKQWRGEMQDGLVWNIEQGLSLTAKDIARAELKRTRLWHQVREFMQDYDLLLLPGTAALPFPVEEPYPPEIAGRRMANYMEWFYLTYAASLVSLPVISVPCGFTKNGLPVGLQIIGRRRQEASILQAASAFEAAAPWHHHRPPVVQATAS
jgi:amidase